MAPNLASVAATIFLGASSPVMSQAEGRDGIVAGVRLLDRRFRPVDGQHLRAFVGEELGRCRADAGRRSRHDSDLAGKSAHGFLLIRP